jgi:hypothetical protein
MRAWMIGSSIVLTAWYALLYVGIPGLCGRVSLRAPEDRLNHLLMAALLAELGPEIGGWRYAASGTLTSAVSDAGALSLSEAAGGGEREWRIDRTYRLPQRRSRLPRESGAFPCAA